MKLLDFFKPVVDGESVSNYAVEYTNSLNIKLLEKFLPIFHCDKSEKYLSVNGNIFFETNRIMYDNTVVGHVVEKNNNKYLYYYMIYTHDGGKQILCYSIGGHLLDIECVIVELDEYDKMTGLCYQPHGTKEHFWIKDLDDLNKICKEDRAMVYMSKSKHASYPIPGKIYRIYGFGNDNCNPKELSYTVIQMSEYLQNTLNYGAMSGFPNRLNQDLTTIPTIRLKQIKYKSLIYKFW